MPSDSAPPRATYRLQFNRDFTFADAERIVPYLARLGISHVYASPWLKARAGSAHGYDIIDHNAFNPEVGDEQDFDRLSAALANHGMGHILDFVPNHMGVGKADNEWWLDVLEWGRASPCAGYFDIDWSMDRPGLRHKVLLPFLGDHYGKVLEAGELVPEFDPAAGTFRISYHDHHFPIAVRDYALLIRAAARHAPAAAVPALRACADEAAALRLTANTSGKRAALLHTRAITLKQRLVTLAAADPDVRACLEQAAAAFNGEPGDARSFRPLHRLLEAQAYRLAYWRVAADEINYRRFFDINELAGIRIENRALFDTVHHLVQRLLAEGRLSGLRIDHIDGLFDPAGYCARLAGLVPQPFYVVVEKILAQHERLRTDWPISGTSGYDFLNQVNMLLIEPAGEAALTRAYRRFAGAETDFDEVLYASRKQVIETRLNSELHVLARDLDRISESHWNTRDYTLDSLAAALREVAACFPVYRTYVDAAGAAGEDRHEIARAIAAARQRWHRPGEDIFDFIQAVLTTDLVRRPRSGYNRAAVIRFAMKFQQYSSPVMAKGFEDTAMYRYHRLTGLNEVGGDPRRFGLSNTEFHRANENRARHWPQAMLATATHDTKRGEDVRARLAVLSAMPEEWSRQVRRWARLNRLRKPIVDGTPAPGRNDEYLLYQTLIGAWPLDLMGENRLKNSTGNFIQRIQAYMNKAIREAKVLSSWSNPNEEYEQAVAEFIARILDPNRGRRFLAEFLPFQQRVAETGMLNSLVQVSLKLTCPGVPDIYQGTELWNLDLVDPDNRRPVDFQRREKLLSAVREIDRLDDGARLRAIDEMRRNWHDGRIKLFIVYKLLALRAEHSDLFARGDYRPLEPSGAGANGIMAFARGTGHASIIVLVRLHSPAEPEPSFQVTLPEDHRGEAWTDVLTYRRFTSYGTSISLDRAFDTLPVAVLDPEHEHAANKPRQASAPTRQELRKLRPRTRTDPTATRLGGYGVGYRGCVE